MPGVIKSYNAENQENNTIHMNRR